MRGLKGGVCVRMCVWLFCFHVRDSCPGEKGPRFCCLQLSPLFTRRGLDLDLYYSYSHQRAFPANRFTCVSLQLTVNTTCFFQF